MEKLKEYQIKSKKTNYKGVKINSNKDAVDYIRKFYKGSIDVYESFFILFLNRQNVTTGFAKISHGGISATVVDLRIIAKYISDVLPSSVIVSHNHPSGNNQPSSQDRNMTKSIKDVCKIFGVEFLDHIILTEDNYYSFKENNIEE
jgi:DNA repair protein RadC